MIAGDKQLVSELTDSVIWKIESVGAALVWALLTSVAVDVGAQPTSHNPRIGVNSRRKSLCTSASLSSFYYLTPRNMEPFPSGKQSAPKRAHLETQVFITP
jgi:hypothetical protein